MNSSKQVIAFTTSSTVGGYKSLKLKLKQDNRIASNKEIVTNSIYRLSKTNRSIKEKHSYQLVDKYLKTLHQGSVN